MTAFLVCDFGFSVHGAEMSTPRIALQSKQAGKLNTPNNSFPNIQQAKQILAAREIDLAKGG